MALSTSRSSPRTGWTDERRRESGSSDDVARRATASDVLGSARERGRRVLPPREDRQPAGAAARRAGANDRGAIPFCALHGAGPLAAPREGAGPISDCAGSSLTGRDRTWPPSSKLLFSGAAELDDHAAELRAFRGLLQALLQSLRARCFLARPLRRQRARPRAKLVPRR